MSSREKPVESTSKTGKVIQEEGGGNHIVSKYVTEVEYMNSMELTGDKVYA